MHNLANKLTLFRLALLPLLIILLFIPREWAADIALIIYTIGAITDWLDGYVARKYNQVSNFGTFLDPISDKIFVVVILLMLVATQHITGIFTLAVIVILVREFVVAGLREFLGPKNIKLPVRPLAKWKTTVQMIATGILIIGPYFSLGEVIGLLGLTAAAVLTVITGWQYLRASLPYLRG